VLVEGPDLDLAVGVLLATLTHQRGELFYRLFSRWLLRPRPPVE
jgi:hypothetical protein